MKKNKYRKKLEQFNSTDKYKSEMDLMLEQMDLGYNEKVLDYGCGIGTMVDYLNENSEADVRGYDKYNYFDLEPDWFNTSYHFQFNVVYFMHSIAHIDNLKMRLIDLKELLKPQAEIYILTPNKDWLDKQDKTNYTPDPTVVKHYNKQTLSEILSVCGYDVVQSFTINNDERLYLKAEL